MLRIFAVLTLIGSMIACGSSQSVAYQEDRKPEDRNSNIGAEGMRQYSKDQSTISQAEQKQQCEEAKIAYLKAKKNKDDDAAERANEAMKTSCLSAR
ncbi:hypothetical protein [Salinimonas iocasae]|uniref:Lipoprotein n=1 Tax=Salinimonas iocasae TaxID=2572577 RepID=A0A5B7YEL8_9ALTE|nr:hypothetical protein [Salinimonas iocasae]QCZ93673.1 hypothetical protein FBQ74_09275 [Salinimonas iocasae]